MVLRYLDKTSSTSRVNIKVYEFSEKILSGLKFNFYLIKKDSTNEIINHFEILYYPESLLKCFCYYFAFVMLQELTLLIRYPLSMIISKLFFTRAAIWIFIFAKSLNFQISKIRWILGMFKKIPCPSLAETPGPGAENKIISI